MEIIDKLLQFGRTRKPETSFYQREDFGGKSPEELSLPEWEKIIRQSKGEGNNVFKEFEIQDTPENRVSIISSYLKSKLSDKLPEIVDSNKTLEWRAKEEIDEVEDVFEDIFADLGFMFEGKKFDLWAHMQDPHIKYRHFERAAWIGETITEEIYERVQYKDKKAIEVFSGLIPGAIYPAAFLHDIGRLVTDSSVHDKYGNEILSKAGIREEIINSIHSVVTTDESFAAISDSDSQKIVRVSDIFSKLIDKGDGIWTLRSNIDEVSKYSLERQVFYWKKEHDIPDTFWYGKSEDDVKKYCDNERKSLEISEKWLQSMGINFEYLLSKINGDALSSFGKYSRRIE